MKSITLFLAMMVMATCAMAQAQTPVTFQWDASADAATAPATNPVRYRLYVSTTLPSGSVPVGSTMHDTLAVLEHLVQFTSGTFYVFCTAYWDVLTVDGIPIPGNTAESGLSNVLKVEVRIPPGNPKNAKVKVTGVANSQTGQEITAKRRG